MQMQLMICARGLKRWRPRNIPALAHNITGEAAEHLHGNEQFYPEGITVLVVLFSCWFLNVLRLGKMQENAYMYLYAATTSHAGWLMLFRDVGRTLGGFDGVD